MSDDVADERGSLAAVILAGGRSRRMGTDKAVIRVGGERLVDRVARLAADVAGEIVVVSGPGRRLDPALGREIPDRGVGPLGGIAAGLATVEAPAAAVLAVDQPDPCPALLTDLAARLAPAPAAAPVVDGWLQPLHAVWATAVAPDLRTALEAGERSPAAWLSRSGVCRIGPQLWHHHDPTAAFAVSWNRPMDLDGRATR